MERRKVTWVRAFGTACCNCALAMARGVRPITGVGFLSLLLWAGVCLAASPLLTSEEHAWLKAHGPLRYAPDPAFPPFEYFSADGEAAGITPDILQLLAENLGTTIEPVRVENWTEALRSVRLGEADFLGSVTRSPEREEYLQFTRSYLSVPYVVFVRKEPTDCRGIQDLRGRRVGVVRGYFAHDWLRQHHPELRIQPVATARQGLIMVALGELDGMVEGLPVGQYLIAEETLPTLRALPQELFAARKCLAVSKTNPRLAAIMQKGLDSIPERQQMAILSSWITNAEPGKAKTIPKRVWQGMLALAAGVLFFAGWNYALRRLVVRRTQALQADIAERQRAEAELRQSQANLAAAQRIAHLGSWESPLPAADNNGARMLTWSEEVYRIFGYEPGQIEPSAENFFRAVHPDDRPRIRDAVQEAIREHKPYRLDHRIIRPDGAERVVHEQAEIHYGPGHGRALKLVGTVQDITESTRAVEKQARLEAQLRQSQKMEAVGQLAGGVAHDFNNLLTVILGHSCLLMDDPGLTPETKELTRQIAQAAGRAANLTRQLLAFSRQQVMRVQRLNLNETLANMAKMLHRLLGEHITLECAYAPEPPCVEVDAGMLEQVIMNLAVNARDAMPKGGRLTLATQVEAVGTEYVRRNAETHPGRFVTLTVTDTGCGMDRGTLGRLFEPFFTTKEIGKGTGLGLATVYGIVKQHNGWIEVASQVGRGSAFKVFWPACAAAAPEPAPSPEPPPDPLARGHETILVVEDEDVVRQMVQTCLSRCGYRVLTAGNGIEALAVWGRQAGGIDLLLTDMVMPAGMTGRELAERLHAAQPGLRVIYTSGYSPEMIGSDPSLRPGANYLPKPYHPEKLARMVRECLDRN